MPGPTNPAVVMDWSIAAGPVNALAAALTATPSTVAIDVVAPASTTDTKILGQNFSNKTFSAFTGTDTDQIDNYNAVTVNSNGTCSWSGSGLGPYSATSSNGDSGALLLQARDASNNVLATAVHAYYRAII
jgi:hypothetical protein